MTNHVETHRLDTNRVRLSTDPDIILFANEAVPIDRASLREVTTIAEIAATIEALNGQSFFGDFPAKLHRAILTPDFHKGAGIPIGTVLDADGFVLPRCAGTDIGCGMRVITTDLRREAFNEAVDLDVILRHAFFEGGRDIPLDERSRAGMLREGVIGLNPPKLGIWQHLDRDQLITDLDHTHRLGSWPTHDLWMFDDYVRGSGGISRDAAIGSIGGGNHFVELQYVDECLDRQTCWQWGLKTGMVTIMAHTGSVSLGSMVGGHFVDLAQKINPVRHDYLPLPTCGPLHEHGEAYLSAMGLAANFAIVNRLVLGAIALRCLSKAVGYEISGSLLYDAPHNLVWSEGQRHLHRKGATPAECNIADPSFPDGHPVIVPGSMGDASYILKGCGSFASLCSAPHGAGRLTARSVARRGSAAELETIRVVTKLDLIRARRDIADEYRRDLLEEAPSQYKPVQPVIDTITDAGIATPVARLRPLLTIKG